MTPISSANGQSESSSGEVVPVLVLVMLRWPRRVELPTLPEEFWGVVLVRVLGELGGLIEETLVVVTRIEVLTMVQVGEGVTVVVIVVGGEVCTFSVGVCSL